MEQFNIEWKDIASVKPYPKNAKKHDITQIANVAESIKQFGWQQPIVCDADGVIIIGHCRLLAAKKLGLKKVPVKTVDNLSGEQVKKLRTLDNKLNESDWDFDLLAEDIGELDFSDFDIDWGLPENEEEKEIIEDEPPEVDEEHEPICKLGDIWQLGRNRLICGDSTDKKTVERLMDGKKADMVFTDPPYGVNIVQGATVDGDKPFGTLRSDKGAPVHFGTTRRPASRAIVPATRYAPIIGDNSTETARKAYEIAKDFSDMQIFFGGNYFTDFLPPSRCWIVWDKGVPDKAFFAPVELAWVSKDANAKLYKFLWSGLCREGDRKIEGKKRIHPTQKPVGLCADILKDFTDDNASVLDLFGGSGSTLIACEQLGRVCYMCEISTHYCDVIIKRWENLTGEKAVKIR